MPIRAVKVLATASALLMTVGLFAGCSSSTPSPSDGSAGSSASPGAVSGKIGLLLPESKTTRYESFDRPLFEAKMKELCADCEIVYANADQDASKQQQQAESALTQGVKVLVLDPVDSAAAASIVASAKAQNVPVVSYDRLITSKDLAYYVSFDNEKVGQLQATSLIEKLKTDNKPEGPILMINGAPTDSNGLAFKKGAHSVLDSSGVKILAEFDTPDWSPDKAQEWMAGQITKFSGQIMGVYAANDGTAGGAIAAMKAGGLSPIPPTTGQDAELAAIQRIITGDQYMTVYKAIKLQAEKAAEVAFDLLNGKTLTGDTTVEGIPSTLLTPVAVTVDNIMDTVVKDGFYTVAQICTADYATACTTAGIK